MSTHRADRHLKTAARALAAARHVLVLTGAGVSAESGIPTFRDALTGLWSNFDAEELCHLFLSDQPKRACVEPRPRWPNHGLDGDVPRQN